MAYARAATVPRLGARRGEEKEPIAHKLSKFLRWTAFQYGEFEKKGGGGGRKPAQKRVVALIQNYQSGRTRGNYDDPRSRV